MEEKYAWITAIVALLAPALAFLRSWWTHKNIREKRESDWREKGQQHLFTQQSEQLKGAYTRITELETEQGRTEIDRDRGYEWARAWFDHAHDQRHRHIATIQMILGGELNNSNIKERLPPPLPKFHDAISKKDT